jgi:hypothetical protein
VPNNHKSAKNGPKMSTVNNPNQFIPDFLFRRREK